MKHLQTFEKYYVEGDTLYHYTSLANAIQIVESGLLKVRKRSEMHKYSNNPHIYDNYGFVSFTEDDGYHENSSSSISSDCRFVFNESKMKKDYILDKYDANEVALKTYLFDNGIEKEDMGDLDYQKIEYFGNEMEIRIYSGSDIPLKKYLTKLEIFDYMKPHSPTKHKKLVEECEINEIKYSEIKY